MRQFMGHHLRITEEQSTMQVKYACGCGAVFAQYPLAWLVAPSAQARRIAARALGAWKAHAPAPVPKHHPKSVTIHLSGGARDGELVTIDWSIFTYGHLMMHDPGELRVPEYSENIYPMVTDTPRVYRRTANSLIWELDG